MAVPALPGGIGSSFKGEEKDKEEEVKAPDPAASTVEEEEDVALGSYVLASQSYPRWSPPQDTRAEEFEGYVQVVAPSPEEPLMAPDDTEWEEEKEEEEEKEAEASVDGHKPPSTIFPGMYAGGDGGPHPAEKLFEIPKSFEKFSDMRSFVVRSDLPAKGVKLTMRAMAMAEIFGSRVVPRVIGWYLTGRIARDRRGREEFVASIMSFGPEFEEED